MLVLLDTEIVARGELNAAGYCKVRRLYRWMDRADARRVIDPLTAESLRPQSWDYTVLPMSKMLRHPLCTPSPDFSALLHGDADIFVTENSASRRSAARYGLEGRVLSIEQFVRRAAARTAGGKDPGELAIREELFCNIDISSLFFASLKDSYPGFERWFARKAMQPAYICRDYDGELLGFLYLKPEGEQERYDDIFPALSRASRLKLGTLKVSCAGLGLGGRFMRITLSAAARQGVRQVYTTLFSGRRELDYMMTFLRKWGFERHGVKRSESGVETVMLLDLPRDKMIARKNQFGAAYEYNFAFHPSPACGENPVRGEKI